MPSSAHLGTLRALVVDDLPEICALYQNLFKRIHGVDIELLVETNAAAAIERASKEDFDLIISDFRMKEADGLQVLGAAFRRHAAGRRVLMTGYNEVPASVERIREAHIDAYIQKPLKTQEVLILVGDMLRGNESSIASHRSHALELEQTAYREERVGRIPG